jgi:hypothetical protein
MYASALGDNAIERYAFFLVSLALTADVTERRLALTRAKDHGLDMERVAIVTAERTIEKAFEVRVLSFNILEYDDNLLLFCFLSVTAGVEGTPTFGCSFATTGWGE